MPSWKRVIVSGSNAALNSLNVTNGITGSLSGTASFASTASFLNSNTNAFIQNGNSFGTTALLGTNDNNSLALETNGSTKMFISSSGNVGIGTTSPAYLLDVQGGTARVYGGAISIDQPSGTSSNLYLNQVGLISWYFTNTATSGLLKIGNGNGDLFNITSAGNVGIGTTSPGTYKLNVVGSSYASSYMQTPIVYADSFQPFAASQDFVGKLRNSAYKFDFQKADGTSLAVISGSGNVGIGTTSPSAKLAVNGSIYAGASDQIQITPTDNASLYYHAADGTTFTIGTKTYANPLLFAINSAEKMRIASTGNVGIGTSSPTARLTVEANSSSSSDATYLALINPNGENVGHIDFNNIFGNLARITGTKEGGGALANEGTITFSTAINSSLSEQMRITSAGNVGIGVTSPANKLVATSDASPTSENTYAIAAAAASDPDYKTIIGYDYSNDIGLIAAVRTSIAWRNIAIPQGNLGIGNVGPTEKLHVTGNALVTGTLEVDTVNNGAGDFLTRTSGGVVTRRTASEVRSDIGAQAALTNPVTGTGTSGRVALWSGTTTQTSNANLTFDGTTFNVGGTLTATVKSFIIDHPTKEGKKLQYGVLEGPEHSVYVRGKLTNNNTITLPDHWTGLVHEDTITVNLTPIGKRQDLWVETVTDTTITVGSDNEINCYYTVFAERKDIEKLVTEFDK